MAVGGITGCILDNLLPGTLEERGILAWTTTCTGSDNESVGTTSIHVYDLPWCFKGLGGLRIAKYLPFITYDPQSNRNSTAAV